MSETSKKRIIPKNRQTFTVCGIENDDKLQIKESKERQLDIPPMPQIFDVGKHDFEIAKDGTIIRKGKDGKNLGTVKNDREVKIVRTEIINRQQSAER